jgi:hypothetical protein
VIGTIDPSMCAGTSHIAAGVSGPGSKHLGRKLDPKQCPTTSIGLHTGRTTMSLGYRGHDRKPETGASCVAHPGKIRTEKGLEDAFDILWRNTRPVIRHLNPRS